jgi:glucose/mannose-6-phosphate isomerase
VTGQQYLDTLGMWEATAGLPEQLLHAMVSSNAVLDGADLPSVDAISNVAIFGVGASGIAASLATAYCAERSPLPVWAGNSYHVPAFVGPQTLAFAISFSGDADETCAAASLALERGAHLVTVAGGGSLGQLAAGRCRAHFELPSRLPASRVALGATTAPLLLTLARMGILPDLTSSLHAAQSTLQKRRDALMAPGNAAEELARRIGRTIPLIYGSSGLSAVAARRWKTQINENAKTPAFAAEVPDVSHNEVAGWGQHGDVTRQVFSLITLRHADEHQHTARRFSLVVDATDEVMAGVHPVWAEGPDDLSRFFDLCLVGDVVSLHLAGREGTDPGPEPAIGDVELGLR